MKKNQEKKKLSLDKLQLTKINNLNKIFGGFAKPNELIDLTDSGEEPSRPPVKDGSTRG